MFLHLKKKYHMNKPVKLKLLSDMFDIKAERNQYDNMQYTAKAKNIGVDYPQKEKGGYLIRGGQEFDFVMSEALYKNISVYEKNANIMVLMKETNSEKNKAGFVWEVKPCSEVHSAPMDNRDSAIKWGMAFNNATRLVSEFDWSCDEKIKVIKEIMPQMFDIACGMPEKPKKEEPKKVEGDDDLPF